MDISSEHPNSQTVRARELTFGEMVHLPPPLMCHMSHVTSHMSCVTCQVPLFSFFLFSYKVVKLVGGGPGGSATEEATSSSLEEG